MCFHWWGDLARGTTGNTSRPGLSVTCGPAPSSSSSKMNSIPSKLQRVIWLWVAWTRWPPELLSNLNHSVKRCRAVRTGLLQSGDRLRAMKNGRVPSLPQCSGAARRSVVQTNKLTLFRFQSYLFSKIRIILQAEMCHCGGFFSLCLTLQASTSRRASKDSSNSSFN